MVARLGWKDLKMVSKMAEYLASGLVGLMDVPDIWMVEQTVSLTVAY